MRMARLWRHLVSAAVLVAAAACGTPQQRQDQAAINATAAEGQARQEVLGEGFDADDPGGSGGRSSVFDLFGSDNEPERQIGVNRYLWSASLDILSFLPLEGADPFSGVIATDWGRIGGDPTPFRVTVFISEPALDARSLRVAAFRQAGGRAVAVTEADNRRLEDAILTRARQLRIASSRR